MRSFFEKRYWLRKQRDGKHAAATLLRCALKKRKATAVPRGCIINKNKAASKKGTTRGGAGRRAPVD